MVNGESYFTGILNDMGVRYEIVDDIPLSRIVTTHPAVQQVREQMYDDATATSYRVEMEKGAEFPPAILISTPDKEYMIVDGYQRYEARKMMHPNGDGSIPRAIVLDPNTSRGLIFAIANRANKDHGLRFTRAEQMGNAIDMMDKYGMTLESAAGHCGLSPRSLQTERLREKHRDRIIKSGVGARRVDSIHKSTLSNIANCGDDDAIRAAAGLACDFNLSVDDISDLCRALKQMTSDADRVAHCQSARDEYERHDAAKRARGRGAKAPEATKLRRGLTILNNINKRKALDQTDDRADMKTRIESAARILGELLRDFK